MKKENSEQVEMPDAEERCPPEVVGTVFKWPQRTETAPS
jgi:hypothetical protein